MKASDKQIAEAFNEWMRRYEEDPEAFSNSLADVKKFLKERSQKVEPTYGEEALQTLKNILKDLE